MGLTEKTLRIGDSLADDKWHSVKFERRGMVMSLGVDHHRPVIGKFLVTITIIISDIQITILISGIQINILISGIQIVCSNLF